MKRIIVLTALSVMLAVVAPSSAAASEYDSVQLVLDFAPGAWTPVHSHGGQVLVVVLQGEITLRDHGVERKVATGESWTENLGDVHQAGNTGATMARVAATFLLPKGAKLTTVEGASEPNPPPGPTTFHKSQVAVSNLSGEMDLVQLGLDFVPGSFTAPHSHGGPELIVMVEGEITVIENSAEKKYPAGQSWMENAGTLHKAGNTSSGKARVAAAFLLPKGVALTTIQSGVDTQSLPPSPTTAYKVQVAVSGAPAILLPESGGDDRPLSIAWPILMLSIGLIVIGWILNKKHARV